jgi:1,4-dihydroxy-2-naphthoate octaprenyltransferase
MLKNWLTVLYTGNLPPGQPVDVVSRWLLATRAQVLSMTIFSALIGGLLAQPQGKRQWFLLLLCVAGLTLAHCANNMLNDYLDYKAGLDTPDYARVQYGPHPIVSGLMSERTLLAGVAVVMGLDVVIGVVLTIFRGPLVLLFAGLGLLISVFYTAEPIRLKRIALGELAVFIVWGPLMTGGTYFVTTGRADAWWAYLASLPYALIVTTVLMGKHLDKREMDEPRGIRTVPVLLGDRGGRRLAQVLMVLFYPLVVALVLIPAPTPWGHVLPLWTLLVLLSIALPPGQSLLSSLRTYSAPKPAEPPEEYKKYQLWPLWFVAWAFTLTRYTGVTFLLGLILGWIVPLAW